jgi:hypothetical protein
LCLLTLVLLTPVLDSAAAVDPSMGSTLTAFRPLQPASAECVASRRYHCNPTKAPKAKRRPRLGACIACREKKSKCDGNRPVCECCVQRETDCMYELAPNESPSDARKRKNEHIQSEISASRRLISSLRSCPEQEALNILHRIRGGPSDPLSPDYLSGLLSPLAQADSHHVQSSHTLPDIEEAEPQSRAAVPSSYRADELDRCFGSSAQLPTERMATHYPSVPHRNLSLR